MAKNIIVVQNAFENISDTSQSILSIREAAHRWKANFYEITSIQFPNSPHPIGRDRIWVYEEFMNYDKVLVLDPDIVINSKAPNIFEELTEDYDLCGVLDGNPGGRFKNNDGLLRDSISKHHGFMGNTIEVFEKYLPEFDSEKYWDNYFNQGVILFRPNKMKKIIDDLKETVFNIEEVYNYFNLKNGIWASSQNILAAFFSISDIRIKKLTNEWNWIIPDIQDEWNEDFYLGPMKPWIYHFCGTSNSKEDLKTYNRWK